MCETLWNYPKDARGLGVNGPLRLSVTLNAISNVTRPDLLQKVLLKEMTLTITKHFCLFLKKRFF